MRKSPPAFQFYADDWIGGTFGMSYEAKGVYIDALALQWSRGCVTDSDWLTFSRLASERAVSEAKRKFDQVEPDAWQNQRLESVRRLSQARAEAGQKGGKQKPSKPEANTEATPEANGQAKHPPSISISNLHLQSPNSSSSSSSNSSSRLPAAEAKDLTMTTTNWGEIWSQADPRSETYQRVREEANRFAALKRCTLDRDLVWQACWVAVEFDRDVVADVCSKLRAGDVRNQAGYLNAAMRKLCTDRGEVWSQLKKLVPPTPPVQPLANGGAA